MAEKSAKTPASADNNVVAELRESFGKGAARKLRATGRMGTALALNTAMLVGGLALAASRPSSTATAPTRST